MERMNRSDVGAAKFGHVRQAKLPMEGQSGFIQHSRQLCQDSTGTKMGVSTYVVVLDTCQRCPFGGVTVVPLLQPPTSAGIQVKQTTWCL